MFLEIVQAITPILQHSHIYVYLIIFFAAILETVVGIGFLLPGSTLILISGAFAARGYFDVGDLIVFALVGAILGDNINYYVGKKYGAKWLKNGIWFIRDSHLKSVKRFFKKHGAKSVFIGRFIPSVKEIAPFIAGTANMDRKTFFIWNLLGAIGWVLELIGIGYIFGQSLNLAQMWLSRTGFFFASILTIFIIFYLIKTFLEVYGRQLILTFISIVSYIWKFIIKKTGLIKLAIKYPKFFHFLKNRFNINSFYGLPLSLFGLVFIYIITLMNGVVGSILKSMSIVSADIRIANLFSIFRTPYANKIFLWITLLGKWEIVTMFVLSTIIILLLQKKQFYIAPLLIAVLGGQLLTRIGKLAIHRARPAVAMFTENSFSFPSGHATIAITFYGFLTYVILRNVKSWRIKINIAFVWFILAILIGFSRLYFGVHYVSDVWGGYLSGILWLIIGIYISEWILSRQKKDFKNRLKTKTKATILSIFIIISSLTIYVWFVFQYTPIISPEIKNNITAIQNPSDIFNTLGEKSKYTETVIGEEQEPISFIIIATNDNALINTFKKSGWTLSDEININSLSKATIASVMKIPYKNAPITPSFWNSETNNIAIQKETELKNIKERHHARFWKTQFITASGESVYVGTASLDIGIKWKIIHKIDPNIDKEREFLLKDIITSGDVKKYKLNNFVGPVMGYNFFGDPFFTDGKQYIIFLK